MGIEIYFYICCCCCSVTKLCPTLQPHGLQHARLSCFSLSPRICPSSCPLSQWFHSTISSFATLFSFGLQSFITSGSFPMSWLFTSGGQSIRVSTLASALPMNIQDWFPLGLIGWSPWNPRTSPTPQFETINSLVLSFLYGPTLTFVHDYWKNHSFNYTVLCQQSNVSVFKHAVYVCLTFPTKEQVSSISWLQLPSAVILESRKIKSVTASTSPPPPPSIFHEVIRPDAMIIGFWMLSFKPAFSLSLSPPSRGSLVPLYFLH